MPTIAGILRRGSSEAMSVRTTTRNTADVHRPPYPTPPPRANLRGQRRLSHPLVVMLVDRVPVVGVCRISRIVLIQTAKIVARVAGGVINVDPQKLRVPPPADKAPTQVRS